MVRVQYSSNLFFAAIIAILGTYSFSTKSFAQVGEAIIPSGRIVVTKTQQSIQMIVTTSQYVAFPQAIVTATNNNPSVLQVQPTQKNEVLISALATGVTQIDARGIDDTIYNVQVVVIGDARELQSILAQHFPTATLHIQPIRDAVIISGQVTSDEHVEQVVTIAEEFYQRVINKIEVIVFIPLCCRPK